MKFIFCKYFKKKLEGFEKPFYPGEIGKKIYNNISKKAWKIWIHEQTKFINENNLNMINQKDNNKVEQYMIKFLFKKK
ncbi:oxidative damage protection protein [Buchnera aphidicola]|uniref:Oxidative damage protection protein n=1 Tax=Buchnera aphidicola (Therioaphis trifolii) TaxID=1241884 RepID=A0A4D6YMG0_9GAMM|nr:oxidative damage protection protein [Buchnera aphidicola]QCI27360.1 oxidative damage protection protein [Buchnera aphidicola (Therioaphis trifolii)]